MQVTGSIFYHRGLRLPGYPLVRSAALLQELCDTLSKSLEFYEETPVTVVKGRPPYRLSAGKRSVPTGRLFLAFNGYPSALCLLAHRIFLPCTSGSLTRVLALREKQLLEGEDERGSSRWTP